MASVTETATTSGAVRLSYRGGLAPPWSRDDRTPARNAHPVTPVVFREYAPRIYNLARRMLGNDADAEDVTQDVLLQVVRKLDTFRGEAQFSTWLHRVTVNAALAHRQKRANRQKREAREAADELLEDGRPGRPPVKPWTVAPDEPVLAAEQHEVIEKAIGTLPEPFRDVYVLADVEGCPTRRSARCWG